MENNQGSKSKTKTNKQGARVKTAADMMRCIDEDIEALKAGLYSTDTVAKIFRGRALQLETARLSLQAHKFRGTKPGTGSPRLIEFAE